MSRRQTPSPPAQHRVLARASSLGAPVASMALGSLAQVGPPIGALLTLQPREFGQFSLLYLLFAWALSLQLSIATEPFVRHRLAHGHSDEEAGRLRAVSTAIAGLMALGCAALTAVTWGSWLLTTASLVAVLGTVVRNGARYQAVVERGLRATIPGDTTFVATFAVVLATLLVTTDDGLTAVMSAWAAAAAAVLVAVNRPRWPRPRVLRDWGRQHRSSIVPLLKDSLVLDLSAIGGAYALLPLLSIRDFGIYRAVSNVATPVRLATEALRPLAGRPLSAAHQRILMVVIVALGGLAGVVAAVAVALVGPSDLEFGVVNSLAPYAVETGVFVGASLVGALLYYRARVHASARELWRGRLWQSGSALVGPLAGAAVAGLDGAIIGTAAATALGAAVWWRLARRHVTRTEESSPTPPAATPPPSGRS